MRLRNMEFEDAEVVHRWRSSPEIADMMFTNDPIEWHQHLAWMRRTLDDRSKRYWIIEHRDQDVGVASLVDIDERNQRCAWTFYIGETGTPGPVGLAVEFEVMAVVFDDLGFNKLVSEVLAANSRVVQLHEHVGFKREGVLREHVWREDGAHDVVVLSMLREEWVERHSKRRRA